MTVQVRVTGAAPEVAEAAVRDLLREVGGAAPVVVSGEPGDGVVRDLGTGIAVAALVLAVPGAAVAVLDLRDRLTRRALAARVAAAKAALAAGSLEAELEIEGVGRIDLARQPVDAVVDQILGDPPA